MTSSRRSSRSIRSLKPPVWRSIAISKNSAATGLSYVFAEPEQGSPLALAKSTLPASNSGTSEEIDTEDRLRSRLASMSSVAQELDNVGLQEPVQLREEATTTSQETLSSSPRVSVTNVPPPDPQPTRDQEPISTPTISVTDRSENIGSSNVPFPTSEHKTPKASPGRSSWFGSLSRAKGKANLEKMDGRAVSSPDHGGVNGRPSGLPTMSSTPSEAPQAAVESSGPQAPSSSSAPAVTATSPTEAPPIQTTVPTAPTPSSSSIPKDISFIPKDTPPPQHQQPARRSWFASSQPPRPEPTDLPPTRSTSMTSIDEEVPSLSRLTPPASPASPSILSSPSMSDDGTGRQRLSSLNPSTSRFTLAIPLLGRPKIPLEQAVAVVQPEECKTQPHEATTEADQTKDPSKSIPAIEVSLVDPLAAVPSSTQIPIDEGATPESNGGESVPLPPASSIQSSSSWWSYVGWGTVPASTSDLQEQLNIESESPRPDEGSAPLPTSVEPTTVSTESSSSATIRPSPNTIGAPSVVPRTSNRDPNEPAAASVDVQQKEGENGQIAATEAPGHTAPASILSSESSAAAWYAPWAWYATAAPSQPAGPSESGDGTENMGVTGEGTGGPEMTPADRVKEAALARPEAAEGIVEENKIQGGIAEAKEEERTEDVNPVAATIASNRSGWASFFSTRSMMMKTITSAPLDERNLDENGMEVMDVDEEGDGGAEEQTRGRDAAIAKAVGGDAKEPPKAVGEKKDGPMSDKAAVPRLPPGTKDSTPIPSRSSSVKRSDTPVSVNKGTKLTAPPLTISESVKRETVKSNPANKKKEHPAKAAKKSGSPSPSTKSAPTPRPPAPNLILPTWADTFHTAPRSVVPPPPTSTFSKTMKFVSGVLFATDKPDRDAGRGKGKGKGRGEHDFVHFGKELPRAWDVLEDKLDPDVLRGCRRVFIIGIHGWFPGAVMRTMIGEPTGTSSKFVNRMVQALEEFQEQHSVKLEKITKVPLEGEGTIEGRVAKLYTNLQANQEWMDDLHAADAILIATHSQGSIVSTHLLDRLIRDGHIRTSRDTVLGSASESFPVTGLNAPVLKPQRVCCLALCGIHLGPLRYLSSSSLIQPYFQYFESAAARELFEFQNTESEVSKNYVTALRSVVDHGVKMVFVASLNDQVVPIYSGLFTAVSHPLILRALYIDGDAYHSSDFLSNLLILLLRILNSGISDSGLTMHLSEATAGSLSGVGHSTAYEDISVYSLAVKYLFLTNNGMEDRHPDLVLEPFNATTEQNDYEIPWSLRDVIADERVAHFFSGEIAELRDAFRDWHPKTSILRDLKRKLQPIQRLPISFSTPSSSKL